MTTLDPLAPGTAPGGPPSGYPPIPLRRIVTTEVRKLFDTRSGFWLVAGVGLLALLASAAVAVLSSDPGMTYRAFTTAVDYPLTLVLPVVAILSVTSEWSQRTGLTTFTLVPRRGRVVAAKAVACVGVAVAAVPLALGAAALGNLAGTSLAGITPVWDVTATSLLTIVGSNVLGVLVGFVLGVLLRSSVAAVVAYFVHALVLPALAVVLAGSQAWFRTVQPWVDLRHAQGTLVDGTLTAAQWQHLAASAALWLLAPLAVGLVAVVRAEVK